MQKNSLTYRDIDYNKVIEYADKKGLNSETIENHREASQLMLEELMRNKDLQKEFENEFHNTAEAAQEDYEQWLIGVKIPTLDIDGMEFED